MEAVKYLGEMVEVVHGEDETHVLGEVRALSAAGLTLRMRGRQTTIPFDTVKRIRKTT